MMNKDIEITQNLIKEILPQYIKIGENTYQLCERFRGISECKNLKLGYYGWDGYNWNWNISPLEVYYQITNNIPTKEEYIEEVIEYNSTHNIFWKDPDYYHLQLNFINCINDFHNRLYDLKFEEIDKVYTKEELFHKELSELLNKHCLENKSNTPDHILANYLIGCLHTFNHNINMREKWYGRDVVENKILGEN